MTEQEWVTEALEFYRPLGFFADQEHLTDAELAANLITRRETTGHRSYLEIDREAKATAAQELEEWEVGEPEVTADMVLLSYDEKRVWWDDGETDIGPGDEIYTTFINDCARIGRGAFNASNVQEEWEGDAIAGVTFDLDGDTWRIYPNPEFGGWIDFEILKQINQIIEESGYKFYMHETGDQTTFFMALAQAELQEMEEKRKWCFWDDEAEE